MRILFIADYPPPEGGVTLLVKTLYKELSTDPDVSLIPLDITQSGKRRPVGRNNWLSKFLDNLWAYIYFTACLMRAIRHCDMVTLHVPSLKLPHYGILTLLVGRCFRKPLLLRKFGGTDFYRLGFFHRVVSHFIVSRVDRYLVETKRLVAVAESHGVTSVEWFPNHRHLSDIRRKAPHGKCNEFVYIGQVRESKGIREICAAFNSLSSDSGITVTIFGPIEEPGIDESFFSSYCNVRYRGQLPGNKVYRTLAEYDALIYPSYWEGEGYPGILIEALIVGLPVIVSNWRAIPEMVTDECAILIPIRNVESLREAILRLNGQPVLWQKMHRAALERGMHFSVEHWAEKFVKWCEECLEGREEKSI